MLGVVVLFICMVCGLRTVRADERIQITNFARIFYIPAVATETGSEKEEITEKLRTVTTRAYCSDGTDRDLSVKWNLSSVDLEKPGVWRYLFIRDL